MRHHNLLFLLFKATFRSSKGFSHFSNNRVLNVFLIAIAIMLAVGFLAQEVLVYNLLEEVTGISGILQTVFILITVICVLFTLPIVVSNVFYSKDYALLAPLPVKKEEIVVAKICVSYLYLLPFALFISLPGIIVGTMSGQLSIFSGIWALCVVIIYPVFLLSSIGLLSWIVMKGESMLKNGGLILFGTNLLFFAGIIIVALMLNSIIYPLLANLGPDFISQVLEKWVDISRTIVSFFKPINWAVASILDLSPVAGIMSLCLLLIANVCISYIFIGVVSKTYYTLGQKLSLIPDTVKGVKAFQFGGKMGQMLQREWWILNNEYFFLAEGLSELFIGPLLILIFGLFTIFARPMIPQFDSILWIVQNFAYLDFVIAVVLVFLATMNTIGPTGISREGKYFYISKVIPIPSSTQYFVKFIFSTLFSLGAGIIAYLGILLVGLNIAHPILVLFTVISLTILVETNVLFFDMIRPNLSWNHPRQAMNSNANVALNMLWVFCIMGIFGGLGFLGVIGNIDFSIILAALSVGALIIASFLLRVLGRKAETFYRKIEI